jgi:hypothetical protein
MELSQTDLESILVDHKCFHCGNYRNYTLKTLRKGARDQCPACRLWLACIDWAVPELLEYSDIVRIYHWETPGIEICHRMSVTELTKLTLAVFQLDSEFA